jgi:catechol 2,3-dioxygenase-like lactoylglutathione lyase family enzyme
LKRRSWCVEAEEFILRMKKHIAHVSLLVHDYDEAIRFYTEKLNFVLIEDTVLTESKRWVLVAPLASSECCILLAKAANSEQAKFVGNQSGGRVFLFLNTDDFWRDYHAYREKGILFTREPVTESYGTVAVFSDLYGNLWDLIQREENVEKAYQR